MGFDGKAELTKYVYSMYWEKRLIKKNTASLSVTLESIGFDGKAEFTKYVYSRYWKRRPRKTVVRVKPPFNCPSKAQRSPNCSPEKI